MKYTECILIQEHNGDKYINMIYIIVLSIIASVLSFYYYSFKDLNYFKKHGILYKPPLPILGNIGPNIFHLKSTVEFIKDIYNLHLEAKYVGMFYWTTPVIMMRDPELIKSITIKYFDTFPDHQSLADEMLEDPLFGKNLIFLHGERWRQIRSLLSPAFTSSQMKSMFKLMSEYAADFSTFLAQLPSQQNKVQIKDVFSRYTNDVIATCAFGIIVDSMRNPNNEFYVYGKEATVFNAMVLKLCIYRFLPWLARLIKLRLIHQKVTDFFRDLVETTIKTRNEKHIVRPDMLQLMMENRDKEGKIELSIEDMVAQAFVFFFAGFETTSTLMSFVAHEIAVNQDVQVKLQNEIDRVLEENNGQVLYEAVNAMEYLDAVICEALRMYPVLVAINRVCVKDFELPPSLPGLKPFTIKKGQSAWIPIYALHHDPKYFEEPEKFDPERFLGKKRKDSLNCGAYLPFGLGPRMCIGNRFALLETKVLFFHLLARCNLKICEKTPIPIKLIKSCFTLVPEGGFWLNVEPRKNMHYTIAANLSN